MIFFLNVTATEFSIILSESWLIYFIFMDRNSKTVFLFFIFYCLAGLELGWHISEAVQALDNKESPKRWIHE